MRLHLKRHAVTSSKREAATGLVGLVLLAVACNAERAVESETSRVGATSAALTQTCSPNIGHNPNNISPALTTPGMTMIQGGGLESKEAFGAMARKAGHGDLVVLRADATCGWQNTTDLTTYGGWNSIREFSIDPGATAAEISNIVIAINEAEAVYFSGGDQRKYLAWNATFPSLIAAAQGVYNRGGALGGSSAGMHVLGGHVSIPPDVALWGDTNLTSEMALPHPAAAGLVQVVGPIFNTPLNSYGVLTDTHWQGNGRYGRTAAQLARAGAQRSFAFNEKGAGTIELEGGKWILTRRGEGNLFALGKFRGTTTFQADTPLVENCIGTQRIQVNGARFDVGSWGPAAGQPEANTARYTINVDGRHTLRGFPSDYFDADPYGKDTNWGPQIQSVAYVHGGQLNLDFASITRST